MKEKKKINKKILFGGILFAAVIAVFALIYVLFIPKGNSFDKTIEVEVIYADETSDTFSIATNEEFLRGALEQEDLVQGEESEYGLYIKTVNKVTADDSKQEWWCVTKGGETVNTGVDSTPIADGDHYEITLTVGY